MPVTRLAQIRCDGIVQKQKRDTDFMRLINVRSLRILNRLDKL